MALNEHKITQSDISANGVTSAPDRLTGTAQQNKAVFDKLISANQQSVSARHNALIDELVSEDGASGIGAKDPDGEDSNIQAELDALDTNKAERDTDAVANNLAMFDENKDPVDSGHPLTEMTANTEARHTHSNKSLLDTYDQTNANLADAVTKKHSHSNKNLLDTYTQTEANLADAVTKKHSHSNKSLLDTYNQTNENLADAVSKKHEHSNKSVLDGITSSLITAWNGAVTWITNNGTNILNHLSDTVSHVTSQNKTDWNAKSVVSVSASGTTTDEVRYITVDGVEKKIAGGGSAEGAVRYDIAQSLTDENKIQARTNIGAISQDQAIYISDSQPASTDVKAWIDTSVGMVVDAGFVFGNVWDINLLSSGWTASSGKYVQTVSALGLDHHFVLMGWIDNPNDSQLDAYALIEDIKSDADGYVTVVCSAQPSVNLPIKVKYHESTEQKTFDQIARSNPNLLDNGWFTVNQRNVSGNLTAQTYGTDRWITNAPDNTKVSFSNNIYTLNTYGTGIVQRLETDILDSFNGKTMTMSAMLSDGTIKYGTATFTDKDTDTVFLLDNSSVKIAYYSYWKGFQVVCLVSTVSIKAIKLELGSISTLYIDSAPNYAEELMKCQRYFHKNAKVSVGYYAINGTASSTIYLPTAMRTIPSVSMSTGVNALIASGGILQVTSLSVGAITNSQVIISVLLNGTTTNYTPITLDGYVDLSADL